MPHWSDYSNGERIKILRGSELNQAALAELTGLSIATIQAAEQDKRLSLPTLLRIAGALGVDTSVVLGQQEPRRALGQDDRAMMRALSHAVHDTAAGAGLPAEAPTLAELDKVVRHAWELYWQGRYVEAGAVAGPLLRSAAARLHEQPAGDQAEAWGVVADAYRISAYVANLLGVRDLAYAAIGHAQRAAERAADELRAALVTSGRSWVYLRDARLDEALDLAERAAFDIEPRFSRASPEQLAVYGAHINFAAVVASRLGDKDRAGDYLSQSHATGARLGREFRAHGTLFGPVSATTQAVGVNVSLGQTGKALTLIESIHDTAVLSDAARHRYELDKAMAQADARLWDASLDTLESALRSAPHWARHQALPQVIMSKVGLASTTRLRRVVKLVDTGPGAVGLGRRRHLARP
ncbi:helix-turn-helix transcriptional regulator [Streptomyces sp. AC536]|uniref:helix-turn-helix domain-containing protein n=1 Tax=Streptomyces buecherae TaxID=2763006 RepID=UPI00164EBDC9|nr:helix-turn-helix transcriptional regulator [Streptomyces buecherae]MBC3985777.1 helix-turn-helix transcriptional regulator [Streptomyces buecherae]QNJ41091.1 helix-turn-helix transcriptional regulator [Streptomyces buecherae]